MLVIALMAILGVALSDSLIPLSPNGYAYSRGNPASNVVVEFFYDLTCSGCRDSWPVLTNVYEQYKDKVNFLYHVYPLAIHNAGFLLTQAAQTVNYFGPEGAIFTFMDTAMKNQPQIYNSQISNLSYNQVVDLVSSWAVDGTGITLDQYYEGMNSSTTVGSQMQMNSHYGWKYGALQSVYQTPSEMVNGLFVTDVQTLKQWEAIIDPLLAGQTSRNRKAISSRQ